MPVLLAWRNPYDISRPDLLDGPAPPLCASNAGRHDQRLTERVRVPCRAGAGLEGDARTGSASRNGRVEQGSIRTVPVNHSAGPFAEGCEPLRLISMSPPASRPSAHERQRHRGHRPSAGRSVSCIRFSRRVLSLSSPALAMTRHDRHAAVHRQPVADDVAAAPTHSHSTAMRSLRPGPCVRLALRRRSPFARPLAIARRERSVLRFDVPDHTALTRMPCFT